MYVLVHNLFVWLHTILVSINVVDANKYPWNIHISVWMRNVNPCRESGVKRQERICCCCLYTALYYGSKMGMYIIDGRFLIRFSPYQPSLLPEMLKFAISINKHYTNKMSKAIYLFESKSDRKSFQLVKSSLLSMQMWIQISFVFLLSLKLILFML